MKLLPILILLLATSSNVSAQYAWQQYENDDTMDLGRDIHYKVEMQGGASDDKTPLWLNANKYGLSSLEPNNGYLRGQVIRPLQNDSNRRWGVGYGFDLVAPVNYTSDLVVQQVFAEARWLHGVLSVGAKEWPMQLKNNSLSSGSQTLGINARPVPQVRIALPEYWTIPGFGRWLHFKGHIAYGKMTDNNWQHDFTAMKSKYADNVLYHSKSAFFKIGSEDRFVPWSVEMGLESATLFGGTSYSPDGQGGMLITKNGTSVRSFIRALIPGGGDVPEAGTNYQNEEGNILGSWLMRVNYDDDSWRLGIYADKYFEDHSSMFQLDYDGYGQGDEWNTKKKTRFFLYDFKDIMLGVELNLKYGSWLRNIVVEYLYTKYQSGPVYHDHSAGRSDHISGKDDYYNHYIFTGWQHWGQAIGNPLYTSPIYNSDGRIIFKNNRFVAWHLGFDGQPSERLGYKVLATYQTGWGSYADPFTQKEHNVSFLVEANYQLPHNWNVRGAFGADFGRILGNNVGAQLTISKTGIFSL